MARVDQELWAPVVKVAREQPDLVARALLLVQEQGPIPASAIGTVRQATKAGQLWNWNDGKSALEYLLYSGQVAVSGRVNFERMYDALQRVLPAFVLARPDIPDADAQRELTRIAAAALGVATEPDLGDYFRLPRAASKARVAELVAAGELMPISVDGWKAPAYLWPEAASRPGPPARPDRSARGLLSPFDSLIWFRDRTERLFGFRYHVEIYTPAAKRVHGYYVLPFRSTATISRPLGCPGRPPAGRRPGRAAAGPAPASWRWSRSQRRGRPGRAAPPTAGRPRSRRRGSAARPRPRPGPGSRVGSSRR
jgi:uncharacterized protein YcaQ